MRYLVSIACLAILGALVFAACNGENPTEPVQPEPKDYRAFFYDKGLTKKLYVYHTLSGRLDSLFGGPVPRSVVVASPDGKRLYYDTDNSVLVVGSDSLNVITELPYRASSGITVSHDNSLLALSGDTLWVLRTEDYSLVFSDTISLARPQFTKDDGTLYCAMAQATNQVYSLNLSDSGFPNTIDTIATAGIGQVIPVPGKNRLVLFSTPFWSQTFELYDEVLDSVLMSDQRSPGSGSVCVSPDGRYAFFGNPGAINTATGPSLVYKVDLQSLIIVEISTLDAVDSTLEYGFPVWSVTATPDSRLLVIQGNLGRHRTAIYDINSRRFVGEFNLESSWCTGVSIAEPK